MPFIANRVVEKDIRDHLDSIGMVGWSAEFPEIELAAIEKPGWIQVFRFTVLARIADGPRVELWGVVRDDQRERRVEDQTLIELYETEDERAVRLEELSEGLTTGAATERPPAVALLILFAVLFVAAGLVIAITR